VTPTIIAVATIVAIITIIAVVATPVIITTAPASATTPALGIGANSDFKIKITGHITEHVTPDIIHEVKFVVTAIVSMPTIPVVIVVPRHVPGDSG
jgi:hypothetical protein